MTLWLLAIALTTIACAALYYAATGRAAGSTAVVTGDAVQAHFRLQLSEIAADLHAGRLSAEAADAARRELAREYVREEAAQPAGAPNSERFRRFAVLPVLATAAIAFAGYLYLGRPDLPAMPLADRPELALQSMSMDNAVAAIERQLAANPDDLRGWQTIAPAYIRLGRYADAERAYRRVLELAPATADAETDLAEALMMQRGGAVEGEALQLLQQAVARDPVHVRSRCYLAGEATRAGRFDDAKAQWNALLEKAEGNEPWVALARQGLEAAEAGAGKAAPEADEAAIRNMVEGLDTRLRASGGTVEEWAQLVRSRLVLKEQSAAQAAYDAAVRAYPDLTVRAALDELAATNGLRLPGAQP